MANQSIIAVPSNIEDPVILRRFLSKVVEQLDIVVGARASEARVAITQKDVDDAVDSLTLTIEALQKEVDKARQGETLDQRQLSNLAVVVADNTERLDTLDTEPATDRMKWRGAWLAGQYEKNDVVKDSGATWVALTQTTGTPGASADWDSLI